MYGIYANIGGILMVNVTIYSSTMDPVGEGRSPSVAFFWTLRMGEIPLSSPGNGDGIATIPSVGFHLGTATKMWRGKKP